ncbi:MAG: hypothetical protein IM594_14920, partial [Cytophagales bacterium]|nr:hypothetical protein [Cytophagales bacterium]
GLAAIGLLVGVATGQSIAQPSVQDLSGYLSAIRSNPTLPVPKSVLSDPQNESLLLTTVSPFLTDTLEQVRAKAFYLVSSIGQKSNATTVRQSAVGYILKGIQDKSTGINGVATEALTHFKIADFNNTARVSLGEALVASTHHLDQVVKLAGYLKEQGYAEKISLLLTAASSKKHKWACRLALARMGNAPAIQYLKDKLLTATVNDDFVYDVVPDLLYTRNAEVFKYIETIVQSDTYACEPADPDASGSLLCAYRVMEYLSPYISNFPLRTDDQGNLEETDYKQALQKLRKWLNENKNYQIKDETY